MVALVDIYNMALGELAADLIADPQQMTNNARTIAARYDDIRDAVLRAHPWNCAIRRASLAAMTARPANGYAYQYDLPRDPFCLRPLDLPGLPNTPWVVEGRRLLTDRAGPLPLRFIARIEDPEGFDPLLVQAVAKRLASVCAYKITKKEHGVELFKEYRAVLAEARAVDGQEGWPDDMPFESTILAARDDEVE